jgi:hypothetical protein
MPKKACCCTNVPVEGGSCCRPIYNGCIGKRYNFSFRFTAKYPCFSNSAGSPMLYACPANTSKTYNIPGNPETFEVNVQYLITAPAEIRSYPGLFGTGNPTPFSTDNCGNMSCQSPSWDANNPSTWVYTSGYNPLNPTTWPLSNCNCFSNITYSNCNFGSDKLRTICGCDTGLIPFIYQCTGSGISVTSTLSLTSPCGPDVFGNDLPFTIIQTGNSKIIYAWNSCYRNYILKKLDSNFQNTGSGGCTFSPGDADISNIPSSYSIQFIPNAAIPEQNTGNYVPKLQPDLLNFNFQCDSTSTYPVIGGPVQGYTIYMNMGFGYKSSFNCGTPTAPIIIPIDIPFQILEDQLFGGTFYDGLFTSNYYNRQSITTDPFTICVPKSTTLSAHTGNPVQTQCTSEILHKDNYTNFQLGNGNKVGGSNSGFGVNCGDCIPNPPRISNYCNETIDTSVQSNSVICNYVNFSNKITVTEI